MHPATPDPRANLYSEERILFVSDYFYEGSMSQYIKYRKGMYGMMFSIDNWAIGFVNYTSGLVNGRGRAPGTNSELGKLQVQSNTSYRVRIINSGLGYALR